MRGAAMVKGTLTVQVARKLQDEFGGQGFDILYDHGKKGVESEDMLGKLHSFFKDKDGSKKILADLDIAVVSRNSKKYYALVEIEEKTCRPKTLLGDVLSTLIGTGILFKGKPEIKVWKGTALLVMAHDATQTHHSRTQYLNGKLKVLKPSLASPNAKIGHVIIDTFVNADDLVEKLKKYIRKTMDGSKAD
jgi:hypothetical protein